VVIKKTLAFTFDIQDEVRYTQKLVVSVYKINKGVEVADSGAIGLELLRTGIFLC
jgi:hypothetical protein